MRQNNKTTTYLDEFGTYSKITYDKIGRFKSIFWILIILIAIALQDIPVIGLHFIIRSINGFFRGHMGSLSWVSNLHFTFTSTMIDWLNLVVGTGVVIVFFFLYIRLFERRLFSTIGLYKQSRLKKYIKGAIIAIVMQLTYFLIVIKFGWALVLTRPMNATTGLGMSALGYVLLFLVGFMIQGASEEIVVRGWMMPVLSRHYQIPTAIAITSVFFGFLHIFNPNINFLSIINLILYGIFAALYALYDGGLWGIFAQHSIWNWFMGNVLGLPVSGMIIGKVSIIETKLIGPSFITGGNFGPEGGIIVTLIEIVGIFVVIRMLNRKGSAQ